MSRPFQTLLFVSLIIILGAVFFRPRVTPKIVVTPENALLDEPIEISISNLPASNVIPGLKAGAFKLKILRNY